jgi:hypothetical protein
MQTTDTPRRIHYSLRLDPQIKEIAERAAANDRRSLANLIEIALLAYCRPPGEHLGAHR